MSDVDDIDDFSDEGNARVAVDEIEDDSANAGAAADTVDEAPTLNADNEGDAAADLGNVEDVRVAGKRVPTLVVAGATCPEKAASTSAPAERTRRSTRKQLESGPSHKRKGPDVPRCES